MSQIRRSGFMLGLSFVLIGACTRDTTPAGEKLARSRCGACHEFPDPGLLDKKTWVNGVLPQMAPRVGVQASTLAQTMAQSPYMPVLAGSVSTDDWSRIVGYFRDHAPDSLPYQSLPAEPQIDPAFIRVTPFAAGIQSSGIITLLKVDSTHERIFVGEAGSNTLRMFDWHQRLLSTIRLASPPTDLLVEDERVLVLESGILDPNDEPRGSLLEYSFVGHDSLQLRGTLIDSLFRPVFVKRVQLGEPGQSEFVICEFGNNRGRLAVYA
ncbi:MAG TPA: hypothetical protein VGG76_01635, partial [Gemmatimonadaceae bacterium]